MANPVPDRSGDPRRRMDDPQRRVTVRMNVFGQGVPNRYQNHLNDAVNAQDEYYKPDFRDTTAESHKAATKRVSIKKFGGRS